MDLTGGMIPKYKNSSFILQHLANNIIISLALKITETFATVLSMSDMLKSRVESLEIAYL